MVKAQPPSNAAISILHSMANDGYALVNFHIDPESLPVVSGNIPLFGRVYVVLPDGMFYFATLACYIVNGLYHLFLAKL